MTRRPAPNAVQDRRALRHYLQRAGEVGLKAYVHMIVGSLRAKAASTPNSIDDVIVCLLEVLVDRLFPPADPEPEVQEAAPK